MSLGADLSAFGPMLEAKLDAPRPACRVRAEGHVRRELLGALPGFATGLLPVLGRGRPGIAGQTHEHAGPGLQDQARVHGKRPRGERAGSSLAKIGPAALRRGGRGPGGRGEAGGHLLREGLGGDCRVFVETALRRVSPGSPHLGGFAGGLGHRAEPGSPLVPGPVRGLPGGEDLPLPLPGRS